MLTLEPTKDVEIILSFIKGDGIRRRVMGGFSQASDPTSLVESGDNIFLLAKINDESVGFVCLFKIRQHGYALHLVLRTVGQRTKDFVEMAILYAKEQLKADSVYAIYPQSAKAVSALCRHFNFTHAPDIEDALNSQTPVPYYFQTLKLV